MKVSSLLTAAILVPWIFMIQADAEEMTVYAAISLSEAMEKAAESYEKTSGDKVMLNLAASGTLARQIKEGAVADLFLSADEATMDELEKAGLIVSESRHSLLSNTLVIAVLVDSPFRKISPEQLVQLRRLARADPEVVPAGRYSKDYLLKLGLWDRIASKVIPAESVRGALAMVESGHVDAGMVYRTDAMTTRKVKVAFEVPKAAGPNISYPVAILMESRNKAKAGAFLRFLRSPEGLSIFRRFGFSAIDQGSLE